MTSSTSHPGTDDAALRLVVEGTVSETGVDFFRALVKNLAAVMGTTGAWVTEYLPEARRLRALAADRLAAARDRRPRLVPRARSCHRAVGHAQPPSRNVQRIRL